MRHNERLLRRALRDLDAASDCEHIGAPATPNAPEDVLGEVALTLVAILGIVLAINLLLSALRIA